MVIPSEAVPVELGDRSYDVLIGAGLLDRADTYDRLGFEGSHAVVVTNSIVAPLYAERLRAALQARFRTTQIIELPDGEAYKNGSTLDSIFDALLRAGCDRRTTLFALGGGVVGDLTGFAASCYMRGVPFVQVPTTLLAQVDSSVGGKTGINHPLGKNMIGTFYQPRVVVIDLDVLDTLPQREFVAGLAEVIKSALVADAVFFDWIEANLDALLARDKRALLHTVRRSCQIKAAIVGQDERESNLRATLNFGHTFGHAIEAGLGYGTWLHGEAVGCGMVMAGDLSRRLGLIDTGLANRLQDVIGRAGLPLRGPALGADRYLELMRLDKKSEGGEIRFVVLEELGRAALRVVPPALVALVLEGHVEQR